MTTTNIVGPYAIYRYSSLDTGKWIIGYTTDLLQRVYYYGVDAIENGKSTASGLYDDIREYGIHRFVVTIIEDGIGSLEEALDRELFYIARDVNLRIRLYNCEGTARIGYPPIPRSNRYILPDLTTKVSYLDPNRRTRGPCLLPGAKDVILYLHDCGWTDLRIAKHMEISKRTVAYHVVRTHTKAPRPMGRPKRGTEVSREEKTEMVRLYVRTPMIQQDIAHRFGVTQSLVSKILKDAGACKRNNSQNRLRT